MNIIYPRNANVHQFLVDARDGYNYKNANNLIDFTDKILYIPKSILTSDGHTLSFKEACTYFKNNGLSEIAIYLKRLLVQQAKMEFLHKVHQDNTHIQRFIQAFKTSTKFRVIGINKSKIVPSKFYGNQSFVQDIFIVVKDVPEQLGVNHKVIDITEIRATEKMLIAEISRQNDNKPQNILQNYNLR